jgi:Mn-dependent DtxR family transcriptional regulator
MHASSSEPHVARDRRLERAIILLLLSGDGGQLWPVARLERELGRDARTVRQALNALSSAGLVDVVDGELCGSSAARRVDALGLIAI